MDSLPADPQGKARIKKEETKNIINTGYDLRYKKFKIRIFTENSIVFPYIFFPYISRIFYNSNKKEPGLNLNKDEEDLYESESEVAQLCPTLCDPMDCSLPGFSVHGILQARILEWAAISFSRGSSRPRDWTWVSHNAGRCFKPPGKPQGLYRGRQINYLLLREIIERNQKQVKKYATFMEWRLNTIKDINSPQIYQTQYNPSQTTNRFFCVEGGTGEIVW